MTMQQKNGVFKNLKTFQKQCKPLKTAKYKTQYSKRNSAIITMFTTFWNDCYACVELAVGGAQQLVI